MLTYGRGKPMKVMYTQDYSFLINENNINTNNGDF